MRFISPRKLRSRYIFSVAGAVEGAGCRLAGAAGGRGLVGVEDEGRVLVGEVVLLENAAPDVLGVGEDHGDEVGQLLLLLGQFSGYCLLGLAAEAATACDLADQHAGIAGEEEIADRDDQPDTADAACGLAAHAPAAPVLDIGASPPFSPKHVASLPDRTT